jgi:hypothetical protein
MRLGAFLRRAGNLCRRDKVLKLLGVEPRILQTLACYCSTGRTADCSLPSADRYSKRGIPTSEPGSRSCSSLPSRLVALLHTCRTVALLQTCRTVALLQSCRTVALLQTCRTVALLQTCRTVQTAVWL